MNLAFRLAWREMRGGLAGFRIFLVCLALGVAAIAAIGSVRMAVEAGLGAEATTLLGGDAEMRFTYRRANDDELAFMRNRATALSEIFDFRSMVISPQEERGLVQVKAVDSTYPLYGTVGLTPEMPLVEALALQNGLPGMVVEQALIDRLGLSLGDNIQLGAQSFELRAALSFEPDGGASAFALGPRVLVHIDGLENSGLISEGTLFETRYRLALPPGTGLEQLEREAKVAFRDSGMRWRDSRNASPAIARFVERMSDFLILVGLAGMAVGGVGIAAAVRAYLERKREVIATLKTLGAGRRLVLGIYLVQIGALALVGIVLGLIAGAALPLIIGAFVGDDLPVPVVFAIYTKPLAEAALYGALTALIFTLLPLGRAVDIRAATLFRDAALGRGGWPRWPYLVVIGLLTAALVGAAVVLSGSVQLTLGTAGGVFAALVVLSAMAWLTTRVAAWAARRRILRGRPALRLALGAIGGPRGDAGSVILSLGLGLSVLAAIGQINANMQSTIRNDLPAEAPAFFFLDIQKDQIGLFTEIAESDPAVNRMTSAPMLRGIITAINGVPAREAVGNHWVVSGDRGVTYADTLPENSTLTAGEWWAADYAGPPLVSFSAAEAGEIGLLVGDEITVNILGRDLVATVASLREVDFASLGINFVMVYNPGAVAGAPHAFISTIYAEAEAESRLLRNLTSPFPNITAIGIREAIERGAKALEGIAMGIAGGAGITLLTGFFVLIGAAASGERARVFEAAVLKTLGATRARILFSFALRAALLGAAAGLVALLFGALAGWGVMTFIMNADFSFNLQISLLIIAGGALVNLLAGLLFAIRPLAVRPAQVLRARD
ncbi:MAG: FtsX-like permease family protein [Paracoccaceae bacterium]